jgi:hypothetical protein
MNRATWLQDRLGVPPLLRLGRCFELGFGRRLRLRLQFDLGFTDPLGAPLPISNPIRHLLAGLVAAMQFVLRSVRRLGRAEPLLGDLGFQLRGAFFPYARSSSTCASRRFGRLRVVALFKPAARHWHDARVFVGQVDLILGLRPLE